MRPNGVFVASESDTAITTAAVLIELQVPTQVTMIEIWRAWISLDGATADAMQEMNWYINDGPATGGTGMTEQEIQGTNDVAAATTALGNQPTQAASPTNLWDDSFHLQNGYLYLPIPEERLRIATGTDDNLGMKLRQAPDASVDLSYGIIWAEYG